MCKRKMKLEETSFYGVDSVISAEVLNANGRQQRLIAEGGTLTLSEGNSRLRCWPLHIVRIKTDLSGGGVSVEAGGETLAWSCADERARLALAQLAAAAHGAPAGPPSDAALAALLEDAEPDDTDAERRVQRLAERLARLDALNVGGMLAAATEGGGAQLAAALEAGGVAGSALSARLARLETLTRAAPAALHARSGAARADAAARALLVELHEIYEWLDAPALKDLDSLSEISLASSEGRARALSAAEALRSALHGERTAPPARLRLGAVRERLRRLARARDALAAALARHLNNALIHLANEAHAPAAPRRRHHADLQPYEPFMRWLKDMDEKAHEGLVKVYVGTWSRVYEREVHAACETARAALAHAPPARVDDLLDEVLTLVESICNAEQDFCTQFFHLDVDTKGEGGDGERSEKSDGGERADARRAAGEARRLRAELFPALEHELVALVAHVERSEPYGAMRALACVGRRVLGEGGEAGAAGAAGEAGEARWARAALAAVAVAAKRGADRAVADRLAALPDAVKQVRALACGRSRRDAPRRRLAHRTSSFAGGAQAEVRHPELHPRAGGDERGVRGDLRARAARRPGPLVPVAGDGHAARHPAGGAPAHAARRGAAGELPPPARVRERAARAGAGRATARRARALQRRAAPVRHAVLRAAAREAGAVLRGRGRGGGGRRARGRSLLPRRLQQARAAPPAGALPGARGAQVAAPAVPHGGEAPERGGRAAAGGVARHAGGVHRATRGTAGPDRGVLPGRGAGAAAQHAGHPGRLLRHRARALTAHADAPPTQTQTRIYTHTHTHIYIHVNVISQVGTLIYLSQLLMKSITSIVIISQQPD